MNHKFKDAKKKRKCYLREILSSKNLLSIISFILSILCYLRDYTMITIFVNFSLLPLNPSISFSLARFLIHIHICY